MSNSDKDSKLSPPSLGRLPAIIFNGSAALGSIPFEKADHKPAPNRWSKKEELGHLIDSAVVNHQRIIRTVVEENPTMPGYTGERWVEFQAYRNRNWIELIKSWQTTNEHLLAGLESMTDEEWNRSCTVDDESYTLSSLVEDYIGHMVDHLTHIGVDVSKLPEETSPDQQAVYPEKPAATARTINELMERRWSPRVFEDRAIETEKIETLLEAARWAPSCFNEQPWRYLIFDGSDSEALERARACLVEGNAWALKAPVLMLSVAKENFTHNDKKNPTAHHDVGLASENLVLQAVEVGLAAHQMAGFDGARARQEFQIPDGFTPLAMIAIGYPYCGSLDVLPEKTRGQETAKRTRKSVAEFAFGATWNKSYTDRQ
jgi:nitroreductase